MWVIPPSLQHTGGRDGLIQPDLLFFTLAPPACSLPHQNHAKMRAQGTANTGLTAPAKGSQENISKFMDAEEAQGFSKSWFTLAPCSSSACYWKAVELDQIYSKYIIKSQTQQSRSKTLLKRLQLKVFTSMAAG